MESMCRLCQGHLFPAPLFTLDKAPAGAQLFVPRGKRQSPSTARLNVAQCSSCGLVQLTNDPVPYYRAAISAAGLSEEMRLFRLRQLGELVQQFALSGRLVAEIGAAKGMFTDLLAEAGADAIGIEGGLREQNGKTSGGRSIYRGYPQRGEELPRSPYSGFICINFLEHAPCPMDFLRSIAASCEFGAAGIIEVPAFEHMVEANLSYDWVADHLSYFDSKTLALAIETAGFKLLSLDRAWHGYDWAATVVRRHPMNLEQMRRSFDSAVCVLKAFVSSRNAQRRRVAIWGASHQSLTLLTQCSFQRSEVPFIIDSAAFKQDTLAPGCGLPVVAPQVLMESGVDCVLIMAAGYSEEIGRQLRTEMGFTGEVAIYRGTQEPDVVVTPRAALE